MKSSDTALHATVILGPGRVGRSIASALAVGGAGVELRGRFDGLEGLGDSAVLLCVPDSKITPLAARIGELPDRPRLVGHTSGATSLEAVKPAGAKGVFSIHPLQTIPDGETDLTDCPAAIAGSSSDAVEFAGQIAKMTGMKSFEISEGDRAIYHAAASIASNFLVTIEQTAAGLMDGIGVDDPRGALGPLVRRSLENWLERGPDALTGPIARGDEATVESHRRALTERRPELLGFYDALAERTREIASTRSPA
jgi:predicted short-subunit dehydrogenase-like oxidoreductase (DUF2520 family)